MKATFLIMLAMVTAVGSAHAVDKTQWPYVCVPAVLNSGTAVNADKIVGLTLGLPEVVEIAGGGYAALWYCRVEGGLAPQEMHATFDWLAAHTDVQAMLLGRTPLAVFWGNATTSRCTDPKGYFPTSQLQILCAGVRKAFETWKPQ